MTTPALIPDQPLPDLDDDTTHDGLGRLAWVCAAILFVALWAWPHLGGWFDSAAAWFESAGDNTAKGSKDPEWVSAIATVAAFMAAVAAAVFARGVMKIESRREDLALEQLKSAQAALVSAWPEGTFGVSGMHRQMLYVEGFNVALRNASAIPVQAVKVEAIVTWPPGSDGGLPVVHRVAMSRGFLPPTLEPMVHKVSLRGNHRVGQSEVQSLATYHVAMTMEFIDSAGIHWKRRADGSLVILRERPTAPKVSWFKRRVLRPR